MSRVAIIEGKAVYLASPVTIPTCNFVGREDELLLCKLAWGVHPATNQLAEFDVPPLHFRLQGPPGAGKNEIVYELARQLSADLYIIQGHEELTPEDLSLVLVPMAPEYESDEVPYALDYKPPSQLLALRASPLATAIYEGGLCFFDEINRVSERALSPLSSVLDGRQSIYSAMTGMFVEPANNDARKRFRFCCALNPALSESGHVLPEYIEQRTLPMIQVDPPDFEELQLILEKTLSPSREFLDAFARWYREESINEISVRQALTFVSYAMQYQKTLGEPAVSTLKRVQAFIFGS